MFAGTIVMEDTTLTFSTDSEQQTVTYTVSDSILGNRETVDCPFVDFTKALAIALHFDGMPNAEVDYPAAESVQPIDSNLRWIP